jgi:hypothetical protein
LNSCIPHIAANKKQNVLTFDSDGGSVNSSSNFSYDHKKVRELASHMILYHEYPFMQMEHVLFNKFMRAKHSLLGKRYLVQLQKMIVDLPMK